MHQKRTLSLAAVYPELLQLLVIAARHATPVDTDSGKQHSQPGTFGVGMQHFTEFDTENPNLKALDLILAAWDEGVDTGVEPQEMAYAALFAALTDLVALYGEGAVIKMTRGLERRIVEGEFTLARRDQ